MMSIELMAMVELLGASTFVLMYVAGFKLFFAKLASKYKKFERPFRVSYSATINFKTNAVVSLSCNT